MTLPKSSETTPHTTATLSPSPPHMPNLLPFPLKPFNILCTYVFIRCLPPPGRQTLACLFAVIPSAWGKMPAGINLSHKHLLNQKTIFLLHLWLDFNAKEFYTYIPLSSFQNICNRNRDRIILFFFSQMQKLKPREPKGFLKVRSQLRVELS